jgi:hypothetical protein
MVETIREATDFSKKLESWKLNTCYMYVGLDDNGRAQMADFFSKILLRGATRAHVLVVVVQV